MSWETHACRERQRLKWSVQHDGDEGEHTSRLVEPSLRVAFETAHYCVLTKAPMVDSGVRLGYLDCRDCAAILWDLVGDTTPFTGGYWAPSYVQMAFQTTTWDLTAQCRHPIIETYVKDGKYEAWLFWSVYYFVKTCAEAGLGIEFGVGDE